MQSYCGTIVNAWLVVTKRISGFAGMFDYGQVALLVCLIMVR